MLIRNQKFQKIAVKNDSKKVNLSIQTQNSNKCKQKTDSKQGKLAIRTQNAGSCMKNSLTSKSFAIHLVRRTWFEIV